MYDKDVIDLGGDCRERSYMFSNKKMMEKVSLGYVETINISQEKGENLLQEYGFKSVSATNGKNDTCVSNIRRTSSTFVVKNQGATRIYLPKMWFMDRGYYIY